MTEVQSDGTRRVDRSASGRRTQAERSGATKERILAATVHCLIELGYSKTTTKAIEQQAQVTRGAVLHHYPSKSDLLLATAVDAAARWQEHLIASLTEMGPNVDPGNFVDAMWRQFTDPLTYAILEMQNAARTDPVLRDVLSQHQQAIGDRLLNVVAGQLGVTPNDPDFRTAIELTWQFMSGAASSMVSPRAGADQEHLVAEWRQIITPYLRAASKS